MVHKKLLNHEKSSNLVHDTEIITGIEKQKLKVNAKKRKEKERKKERKKEIGCSTTKLKIKGSIKLEMKELKNL